jgi:hypothetical protein
MQIEVVTSPDKEALKTISKGIESFNQKYMADEVVFELRKVNFSTQSKRCLPYYSHEKSEPVRDRYFVETVSL